MIHLELPSNPLSDPYEALWFILSIVMLFLIPALSALNIDKYNHVLRDVFAAIVFIIIIYQTLLKVSRYRQACRMIDEIGEKAWREQVILRQEKKWQKVKGIHPWNASEHAPWL